MLLNSSQHQAVHHADGHLLIVAGPGTGKTHTLTQRMLHLSSTLSRQEKILAITFTNKAAHEMRERVAAHRPHWETQMTIGTFHHVALLLLRRYHQQAGLAPDFKIASLEQTQEWAKELWPEVSASERKRRLEEMSWAKSVEIDGKTCESVLTYQRHLRQRGCLDFDDLLCKAVELLTNHPEVRQETQDQHRHIFVDEYQDINPIQHRFLKLLVGESNHCTAIGDPNQAIYGFRGANVKFFESFAQDFPGAVSLVLSENYRSTANLLSASSQIMAKGRSRHVPELIAQIYRQGRLLIHDAVTDKAEAEYVVHQIEKMVGGTSMFSHDSQRVQTAENAQRSFRDIVILYRLKTQRQKLEEALQRSGIPYRVADDTFRSDPEELVDLFSFRRFREDDLSEKVCLMTLHASKGLEFPVVFIVGCEEGLTPLNFAGMSSDIEEERRLFYVGMTRAKEQLFLLRARKRFLYGKFYENPPSPFLLDIEEELKEYEETKVVKRKKRNEDQMSLF